MRLGIISPRWLPDFGGAQYYVHQLAGALAELGFSVFAFCGSPEKRHKDNGIVPVTRWSADRRGSVDAWRRAASAANSDSGDYFWLYQFMDAAVDWAVSCRLDIVLVNSPITDPKFRQARELYGRVQAHGIKVGAIHHDLDKRVQNLLVAEYRKVKDWAVAANVAEKAVRKAVQAGGSAYGYHLIGSPLFFSPDFLVTPSEWTGRFIDPLGVVPRYVLHPWLDPKYWSGMPDESERLDQRDILMVNPLAHKGRDRMARLILTGPDDLTFRVLQGGYGTAFEAFRPMVELAPAVKSGRVEFLHYVRDMREAYSSSRVVLFPSLYEGYGMTAVEPMFVGTPVVSSNYPAIIEAVGDGARTLCPYLDTDEAWLAAITDVMNDSARWRASGRQRVGELLARQKSELDGLVDFLKQN